MRDELATLAPQERRVLRLVAEGKTNREIGAALHLSEKTVKNYLSHTFEKLQVSRRAQAAVLLVRDRLGQGSGPSAGDGRIGAAGRARWGRPDPLPLGPRDTARAPERPAMVTVAGEVAGRNGRP
jgi:DNA-binding CsgD family transcriptional regulator